ncbi:hypothetical protein C4J89_3933 [Pseudomonas sp. R4-35-07]|nr:hypothetical protein [Pseudomonas sp. R4-35-07]AZF33391.1 hypothetical protein C4J89_3933 [Pseudomonas sp. R4-35-07]
MTVSLVTVRRRGWGRLDGGERREEIKSGDMELLMQAISVIGPWHYMHGDVKVIVECDFFPFVEAYKINIESLNVAELSHTLSIEQIEFALFPELEFVVKVTLESDEELGRQQWYVSHFVEQFLYDIFFILNIARPGVCDFLGIRIDSGRGLITELRLSADCFESGFRNLLAGDSLFAPRILPLSSVVCWYKKLNMGVRQRAESGVEKAIFSVLHICCGADADVVWVIWAFHALEAIYGTKVGEGFTNLVERISTLLKLDAQGKRMLKKHLREMYDCRSSFVHGGYRVHHPMKNEIMDQSLNEDFKKLLEVSQFGFNLVVLSLQALVENGWYGLKIEEQMSGVLSDDFSV